MLPDEKETLPIDVDTQERGYLSAEEDPEGFSRLKDDINRFKRGDKNPLPRLTAYCFASSYKIREMSKWFLSKSLNTKSMIYDECLYLPNAYPEHFIIQHKDESANLTFHESTGKSAECHENDILIRNEAFLFDYGVAVLWGMTETMENEFLHNISQFALEMLDEEDQQCEDFNFFYDFSAQPRIYNDVITLRSQNNHLIRMSISHALAQSSKISLFEELVETSIEQTRHIPQTMAKTGLVKLSRNAISKKIGQLFIMRVNVNLVSNILDTPEIFWSEPNLQPIYDALRSYLEIPQRIEVLNHRVSVISDLLEMLNNHLNGHHGEFLEWIVIILIGVEIVLGLVTILIETIKIGGH